MTPEQLKASILQMAIQGKLVEQRPEEGTAEDLYDQIQAEKQKLIKEGKIKKEKPLAEIVEDEITFDIPMSWRFCRLGECIDLLSGQDLPSDRYNDKSEGTVYLTGASNIDDNGQIIINRWTTTPTSIAKQGNLLLTCKGTIGKTCVLSIPEAHIARQIMAITEILVSIEYLRYFIEISISNLQSKAKSMIPGIDRDTVRGLIFPLPPLKEQHRIVAKIEELLPYVDRYAEAYEKLEQFNAKFPEDMKKSILQYAIQGKLVEQRPEEGTAEELYQQIQANQPELKDSKSDLVFDAMEFDIPEGWKWVEVNQVFEFVDYRGKTPNKISQGVFLITASNIKKGYMEYTRKEYISEEEYETRKGRGITEIGDLLFTTEAPMGNAAICDLEECSCGQRVITFKEYTQGTINKKLFMYFILSPAFQKQLVDNCTGTTAKGIKADKLKHLLLPLPPINEQHRIVDRIEALLPYCDKLQVAK